VTGAVAGFPMTGEITYYLFSNGNCYGAWDYKESVELGAESTPTTFGPGSYSYRATYSGDGNYESSTGACEPFAIGDGEFLNPAPPREIRRYWDDDDDEDDDDEDNDWSGYGYPHEVSVPGSAIVRDEVQPVPVIVTTDEFHTNDELSVPPFPIETVPIDLEPFAPV